MGVVWKCKERETIALIAGNGWTSFTCQVLHKMLAVPLTSSHKQRLMDKHIDTNMELL